MQATTPLNRVNETRYCYPADGNWETRNVAMKASTAMADGALVSYEVSGSTTTGYATLAGTTSANGQNLIGILQEKIATTDTDYATAGKLKKVLVPTSKRAQMFFTRGAGTLTAIDVGKICNVHTDSLTIAVDSNGLGVQITGYIDADHGLCTLDVPIAVTA